MDGMLMTTQLETTSTPGEDDLIVLDDGLGEFNKASADLGSVVPLVVFAKDDVGKIHGGVIARTWGECCEIQVLWVDQDQRDQGIGTRLMSAAETEAISRGCRTVFLETFSFQAPDFYSRRGFQETHSIGGLPDGIRKIYMQKSIGE